jgi:hypothetical protein
VTNEVQPSLPERLIREIAEYPNSFAPLGPKDVRIETSRYTLWMGSGSNWNTVQRQHLTADEIGSTLEEVRALLRERGRDSTQWEVGSAAEPADLVDQLLKRGLVRDKDPVAAGLVLTTAPPKAEPGLVARRVKTFEEYAAANAVQWEAFEPPAEDVAKARALLEQRWLESPNMMHAVWLDGEMVAAGTAAPTDFGVLLFGGATVPRARGRGAYRALLRARWDEAVRNGTPQLFTQGGAMSAPILQRVGFKKVGEIQLLLDEFGKGKASTSD